jgi:hypothetical protein
VLRSEERGRLRPSGEPTFYFCDEPAGAERTNGALIYFLGSETRLPKEQTEEVFLGSRELCWLFLAHAGQVCIRSSSSPSSCGLHPPIYDLNQSCR